MRKEELERQIVMFLEWMSDEKQAHLCAPGYAGEMIELGHLETYIAEYVAQLKTDGGI